MACTVNGLLGLKDFPKGLRVLVVDEDSDSAAEIRSKLEEMDYVVSIFCNESKALSAISSKSQIFHVAIVGVSSENSNGSFKFLKNAKDLPTIMTSNIHCLSTMMQCIAHGAVEFLRKPLSEDKLRNIWQHVVHKAFNAGGNNLTESLMPIKEPVTSMLQLKLEHKEPEVKQGLYETENEMEFLENIIDQSSGSDKFPAPTTPQLKYGGRLLDEADCLEKTYCPIEKEDGECKSVETTCANAGTDMSCEAILPERSEEMMVKEENDCVNGSIGESNVSSKPQQKNGISGTCGGAGDAQDQDKVSTKHTLCGTRGNRKKVKVDWTPELHKKFVQAVEQLGVDQAIPSRILDYMKVQGLTRHNVASHLQKYRIHRRHILPKEDDRRWSYSRDVNQRGYRQHKPVMPYPQYHLQQPLQHNQVHPLWSQPGVQYWSPAGYPSWLPAESWQWNPYPTVHADAWGCPVMPPPHGVYCSFPQNAAGYQSCQGLDNGYPTTPNSFDFYPEEEIIDKVVKEAMSKPWLPLPLGLKPPSTESVVAELYRQGIPKIPPQQHTTPNQIKIMLE